MGLLLRESPAPEVRMPTQSARAQFVVKGEDSMVTAELELAGGWSVTMHAVFDGHGGRGPARRGARAETQREAHTPGARPSSDAQAGHLRRGTAPIICQSAYARRTPVCRASSRVASSSRWSSPLIAWTRRSVRRRC